MISIKRTDKVNGGRIKADLESAGFSDVEIFVLPDEIRIEAVAPDGEEVSDDSRIVVETAVANHDATDTPAVNRNQKTIDQLQSATTVAQIKAALIRHFTERGV